MDCILWSQPMLRRVNPVAGEPPTGEPDAGDPLVRFGGRGGHRRPYPYPAPTSESGIKNLKSIHPMDRFIVFNRMKYPG